MNISSTRTNPAMKPLPQAISPPVKPSTVFTEEPKDAWVGAGLSLAGGAATLTGALSNQPLLTIGGTFVVAAATALTAQRVQTQGAMDSAAWISFAGGGALSVASALCLAQPIPSVGPTGPLPTLLRQLGVQAL